MYKFYLIIIMFSFTMCSAIQYPFKAFQSERIEKIHIVNLLTKKEFSIDDSIKIHTLFDKYLSNVRKKPYYFKSVYRLVLKYDNKEYSILVNANHIKINGVTYVLKDNLEEYIRNQLIPQ